MEPGPRHRHAGERKQRHQRAFICPAQQQQECDRDQTAQRPGDDDDLLEARLELVATGMAAGRLGVHRPQRPPPRQHERRGRRHDANEHAQQWVGERRDDDRDQDPSHDRPGQAPVR